MRFMDMTLALAAAAAAIPAVTASPSPSPAVVARGAGGPLARKIHPAGHPDLCLTVATDSNGANGKPAYLTRCGQPGRQLWYMATTGSTQVTLFEEPKYCLDATQNIGDGAKVGAGECSTTKPQQTWYLTEDGRISVKDRGVCLTTLDITHAEGVQLETKACGGDGTGQVWTLDGSNTSSPATSSPTGVPGVDFPSHAVNHPTSAATQTGIPGVDFPSHAVNQAQSTGSVKLASGALSEGADSTSSSPLMPAILGLVVVNLLVSLGLVALQFFGRGRGREVASYAPVKIREDTAFIPSAPYKDQHRGYSDQ